jgi:hypothetical protein
MRMNTFVVYDKAKPHRENTRGLNLAVVKLDRLGHYAAAVE